MKESSKLAPQQKILTITYSINCGVNFSTTRIHFDQMVVTNGVTASFHCYKIVHIKVPKEDQRVAYVNANQRYFFDPGRRIPFVRITIKQKRSSEPMLVNFIAQ